jgi:hypothetical protein
MPVAAEEKNGQIGPCRRQWAAEKASARRAATKPTQVQLRQPPSTKGALGPFAERIETKSEPAASGTGGGRRTSALRMNNAAATNLQNRSPPRTTSRM